MKAVILVAGMGTRLSPLTDNTHKALVPIGSTTTLDRMVQSLIRVGVHDIIFVTGHMQDKISSHIRSTYPEVKPVFVHNDNYATTNTGYSLLLARPFVEGHTFLKFDGDVSFDESILQDLVAMSDETSVVTVDNSAVDEEVIKVVLDDKGNVVGIGNRLPVSEAAGESIGIEKIAARATTALFDELAKLMSDEANLQKYYEVAYHNIITAGEPFRVLDITGRRWVEMDNLDDHADAVAYFGTKEN